MWRPCRTALPAGPWPCSRWGEGCRHAQGCRHGGPLGMQRSHTGRARQSQSCTEQQTGMAYDVRAVVGCARQRDDVDDLVQPGVWKRGVMYGRDGRSRSTLHKGHRAKHVLHNRAGHGSPAGIHSEMGGSLKTNTAHEHAPFPRSPSTSSARRGAHLAVGRV